MALPTNLSFAQMQQTLGGQAMASAPKINYSNPFRKGPNSWDGYGSDPRRLENLRQQQGQYISNLQSALNYKIASEEYERQKKLRPQIEELEELKRKDLAERIKMERAALGGDLETAGKIAYQRSLRDQKVQSLRDKAELEPAIRGGAMGSPQYAPLAGGEPIQTVVRRIPAMPQEVGSRSAEEYQSMRMAGGVGGFGQLPAPFMPTGAANQAAPMAMPVQFTPQRTGVSLTPFGGQQNEFQRAYVFGREQEELERLRMAAEGRRLQSQMAAQPQMEAIRSGIMGRMVSGLGVSVPSGGPQPYSSGTGYTPSWMQNYQPPQFPRYS